MADEAHFKGTRAELLERLTALPALLAGHAPDPTGAVPGLLRALGVEAMAIVREAFLVKSRGGTDAAGIRWDPLRPATVAYGRDHPGARPGPRGRPLLTAAQDKLWRGVFANSRARTGDAAAAAALAWAVVKARGGRTLLGAYGGEKALIGIRSGALLDSFSPGVGPGEAVVKSGVPYAAAFHKRRPLWPGPGGWPREWLVRLADALGDGLKLVLQRLAGG